MTPSSLSRPSGPRAVVAAALSFVLPGLGQGYNGQWALAAALVGPVLLLIGLVAVVALGGGSGTMSRLLDARVLVVLLVLNGALLAWRIVAIVQAHTRRSTLSPRRWSSWLTVMLLVVTVAMHAVPAWYTAKVIDTLGTVALEGSGGMFEDGGVAVQPPSMQPEVGLGERVTILLVGVDFAPGRTQHLTDTMLVATLDPDAGDAAMVSIPRDLYGVPLGDGRVYNARLNSLLSTASADPATYPLGGPATLKAAIGELLGARIHYFAAIDIEGLRAVIDTIGGVDVTVERAIDDPTYPDTLTGERGLYIPAGPQHLDGATALGYVRSRMSEGESDFTRAERQQRLLTAIAASLGAGELLVGLPGLLDAVKENMVTDIPAARIPDIAAEVEEANLAALDRVVLTPDDGYVTVEAFSAAGYILHPNLEAIADLGARIFGSEVSEAR